MTRPNRAPPDASDYCTHNTYNPTQAGRKPGFRFCPHALRVWLPKSNGGAQEICSRLIKTHPKLRRDVGARGPDLGDRLSSKLPRLVFYSFGDNDMHAPSAAGADVVRRLLAGRKRLVYVHTCVVDINGLVGWGTTT